MKAFGYMMILGGIIIFSSAVYVGPRFFSGGWVDVIFGCVCGVVFVCGGIIFIKDSHCTVRGLHLSN